jgi:hypothetical protein
MRKISLIIVCVILATSYGCRTEVSNPNGIYKEGYFTVENGSIPKNITYSEGFGPSIVTYDNLERFEKGFFMHDYDNNLIVRGKKVSSKSFYKDNGPTVDKDGYKKYDIRSYTLSDIEITEVLQQRNINDTKFKKGDIITIYEYYYYKPGSNNIGELILPNSPYCPVVNMNEDCIFYLQSNNDGYQTNFEKLDNVWLNYTFFIIDDKTKNVKDINSSKKLKDESKYYGINYILYYQVINKYV